MFNINQVCLCKYAIEINLTMIYILNSLLLGSMITAEMRTGFTQFVCN